MSRAAQASKGNAFHVPLAWLLLAGILAGCGHHRPRIRLHGGPDDTDLAEILEQIVDEPERARSYAPDLEWSRDGRKDRIDDPNRELQPFRSFIKLAVAPPRDANPTQLRCHVSELHCLCDHDSLRTAFHFEWRGQEPKRYLVLDRMESTPRK
jgi:hypothetical protein